MAIGRIMVSEKKLKVGKTCLLVLAAYLLVIVGFYYLAGYQLHFRASRNNVEMTAADAAIGELDKGTVVEQQFVVGIDRLQKVSVQWGTYYRTNSGIATMELRDRNSGAILLAQTFDVSTLSDGDCTVLQFEEPLDGYSGVPLCLRIYADSTKESAATTMRSFAEPEGFALSVNGIPQSGSLCMAVSGEEYIWTGLHYWQLAGALGVLIAAYLFYCYARWRAGKTSLLLNLVVAMKKYRFLIKQLVNRDFKIKYKRSVLGVFWSFLNPLLTMGVQYVVFSTLFRSFAIAYYQVYLLAGIVMFNYFSESCGLTLMSVVGNAALITKVYVPKYIYPLTRVMSSLINLLISLIPLLLVSLISGIVPTKAYFLILFPVICLALFCLGLGMFLATSMVFFRDTQFLWGIFSMIWMYLTPIFYPVSILPQQVMFVLKANPMFYYIDFLRTCIIEGVSPEPRVYMMCAAFAIGMLLVGIGVFKKNQDKFVLYL